MSDKPPDITRALPNSADAEKSVLGLLLTEPGAVKPLAAELATDDFYVPAHRIIFETLSQMWNEGTPLGLVALQEALIKNRKLEEIGGAATVPGLLDNLPGVEHFDFYADLLREKTILRKRRLTLMKASAADGHGDEEKLGEALVELAELSSRSGKLGRAEELLASGRSLTEIAAGEIDDEKTLLGRRWLCKGARPGLVIAPTGVGKSVVANQAAAKWSLGEDAFGISPAGPLRLLIVQAENDEGDETEATAGIFSHFDFTAEDRQLINERTLSIRLRGETGTAFLNLLRELVDKWKPDLVILDPLGVFLGDDPKDTKAVTDFFDGPDGLSVIAEKLDVGILVVAHTPKTNHRDTSSWTSTDWAYSSAGCAKLNDSSGSTLTIDQADEAGSIFRFIAGKRGQRIGWLDSEGLPTREKFFKHGDAGIYWEDSDASEVENERRQSIEEKADAMLAKVIETVNGATHPDYGDGIAGKAEVIGASRNKNAVRAAIDSAILKGGILFEFSGPKNKKFLTTSQDKAKAIEVMSVATRNP